VVTPGESAFRSLARSALVVWALGLGAAGCSKLAGIEDAQLDPALADGATGPGTTATVCTNYCSAVMEYCTGAFAVYGSQAACLAVCAHLPLGSPGDTIGNSAYCRLQNAELAGETGEPNVHCPAAAPGASGVCGSNCEGYCVLMQQICSVRFSQAYQGLVDCQAQCDALPTLGAFDLTQSSGNSVNCRLWHVSAAALDPGAHCGHAAGDPPCAS
jgi:hypothetical protein